MIENNSNEKKFLDENKIQQKYSPKAKDIFVYLLFSILTAGLSVLVFLRLEKIGQSSYSAYIFTAAFLFIFVFIYRLIFGPEKTKKCLFNSKTAAIILILISVLISFFSYSGTISKNLGPIKWQEKFSANIRPSLRSVLFAILLFSSIFVRYGTSRLKDVFSYVILVLDILFISSFLNILCNNEAWPIPFFTIDNQSFLILAVLFSWFGISAVSGFIWIAIFIAGMIQMAKIENLMGFAAVVYLICAFVSLILQIKIFDLHFSFVSEFFAPVSKRVKTDVISSAQTAANIASGGLVNASAGLLKKAENSLELENKSQKEKSKSASLSQSCTD